MATTTIPALSEFLSAGVQFGHQAQKWNPKMREFIFSKRGGIHIIDLSKTLSKLEEAANFLETAAGKGEVMFLATKRQAREIVKNAALNSKSHYIINRWPGGLLTNYDLIKKSLSKLLKLEEEFERGVEDRTKFEVSQMKKDWVKMNRLYEGVKHLKGFPSALVVIDSNYEKGAIREAKRLGIPVVAMVDSNCDPDDVNYIIPANDDAIKSIELIVGVLTEAVKAGNKGKGVEYKFKDYSKAEVKLIKREAVEVKEEVTQAATTPAEPAKVVKAKSKGDSKGMLEKIQQQSESKKIKRAASKRATK